MLKIKNVQNILFYLHSLYTNDTIRRGLLVMKITDNCATSYNITLDIL